MTGSPSFSNTDPHSISEWFTDSFRAIYTQADNFPELDITRPPSPGDPVHYSVSNAAFDAGADVDTGAKEARLDSPTLFSAGIDLVPSPPPVSTLETSSPIHRTHSPLGMSRQTPRIPGGYDITTTQVPAASSGFSNISQPQRNASFSRRRTLRSPISHAGSGIPMPQRYSGISSENRAYSWTPQPLSVEELSEIDWDYLFTLGAYLDEDNPEGIDENTSYNSWDIRLVAERHALPEPTGALREALLLASQRISAYVNTTNPWQRALYAVRDAQVEKMHGKFLKLRLNAEQRAAEVIVESHLQRKVLGTWRDHAGLLRRNLEKLYAEDKRALLQPYFEDWAEAARHSVVVNARLERALNRSRLRSTFGILMSARNEELKMESSANELAQKHLVRRALIDWKDRWTQDEHSLDLAAAISSSNARHAYFANWRHGRLERLAQRLEIKGRQRRAFYIFEHQLSTNRTMYHQAEKRWRRLQLEKWIRSYRRTKLLPEIAQQRSLEADMQINSRRETIRLWRLATKRNKAETVNATYLLKRTLKGWVDRTRVAGIETRRKQTVFQKWRMKHDAVQQIQELSMELEYDQDTATKEFLVDTMRQSLEKILASDAAIERLRNANLSRRAISDLVQALHASRRMEDVAINLYRKTSARSLYYTIKESSLRARHSRLDRAMAQAQGLTDCHRLKYALKYMRSRLLQIVDDDTTATDSATFGLIESSLRTWQITASELRVSEALANDYLSNQLRVWVVQIWQDKLDDAMTLEDEAELLNNSRLASIFSLNLRKWRAQSFSVESNNQQALVLRSQTEARLPYMYFRRWWQKTTDRKPDLLPSDRRGIERSSGRVHRISPNRLIVSPRVIRSWRGTSAVDRSSLSGERPPTTPLHLQTPTRPRRPNMGSPSS